MTWVEQIELRGKTGYGVSRWQGRPQLNSDWVNSLQPKFPKSGFKKVEMMTLKLCPMCGRRKSLLISSPKGKSENWPSGTMCNSCYEKEDASFSIFGGRGRRQNETLSICSSADLYPLYTYPLTWGGYQTVVNCKFCGMIFASADRKVNYQDSIYQQPGAIGSRVRVKATSTVYLDLQRAYTGALMQYVPVSGENCRCRLCSGWIADRTKNLSSMATKT